MHAARKSRRRPRWRAVLLSAAAWLGATSAAAGPPGMPPGMPPGATATRQVSQYEALEAELADHAARRDRAALLALVDPDFAGYEPGAAEPLDRASFVAAELVRRGRPVIYALDVLERGDLDLVSFLARPQGSATTAYIVDVWRRADHQLLARYRSQPRHAPPPPTRPSGRS